MIARMDGYASTLFKCNNAAEIQEMYQFLCGECYLYIDSLVTCDEKDARAEASDIVKVITSFFEMINVWLKLIPSLTDYAPLMRKHPYLYLVCPEAAILNLSKSFITSLELIFGTSPRSEEFLRASSSTLGRSSSLATPKYRGVPVVSFDFLIRFRFNYTSWKA